jgi:hypothetical protein
MENPKTVGIIPDFFHDIIAFLIPGYVSIILLLFDFYFMNIFDFSKIKDMNTFHYLFSLIIAYVLGRFLEQLGYLTIHNKNFPFIGKKSKTITPKWSLLFDKNESSYTNLFKENLRDKIGEFLKNQNGIELLKSCEELKKDDYFNIIQYYLREKFPAVALYEKKQNATIALTRSLAIVFFINIIFYHLVLFIKVNNYVFSWEVTLWLICCAIFSYVFYKRFQLDKKYHAMFIFETFSGTDKLFG